MERRRRSTIGRVRLRATAATALPVAAMLAMMLVVAVPPVGARPTSPAQIDGEVIEVHGRGFGHGRGMGQYGAYGYAADHGWNSGQILDHFYGGTIAGPAPTDGPVDPASIRVDLRYMHGLATSVGLGEGMILLLAPDGTELGQVTAGAVRLQRSGDGYEVASAPGCDGPWSAHSTITGQATVRLVASSNAPGGNGQFHTCGPGYRVWYQGEMQAAVAPNGGARTVNVVSVEQYLRGVVPNEVPAWWPQAALEAQAVAARSYAMAGDSRWQPYADTCDTVLCQVYDGVFTERWRFRQTTDHRTDAAVAATSGIVRLWADGSEAAGTVARTEFSSSTGGYSAGGAFTAVPDFGNGTDQNPNHTWTELVEVAPIEQRYGLGELLDIEVVERTGLGAGGGRATSVEFRFDQGTVTETGTDARSILGLKSDWFAIAPPPGGDLRATSAGTYIDRMHTELAGRPATDEEIVQWYEVVESGNRQLLTSYLVRSDHAVGALVDGLYQRALGKAPDPGCREHWVRRIGDGASVDDLWVWLYGSPGYYLQAGGTNGQFVASLSASLLGHPPDPVSQQYWTGLLDRGVAGREAAAADFVASHESRWERSAAVHQRLLGPVPSVRAHVSLAHRLRSIDDLDLLAELAASPNAFDVYTS